MFTNDFLLRQIRAFSLGLAQRLAGVEVEIEDEQDLDELVGNDLPMLEGMATGALLTMFRPDEAADRLRCTALALALAARVERSPEPQPELVTKALALLHHARAHADGEEFVQLAEALERLRG